MAEETGGLCPIGEAAEGAGTEGREDRDAAGQCGDSDVSIPADRV